MRRFIITGAPGAGKSAILAALGEREYAVVAEAATDVIAERQRDGVGEPWADDGFIDAVARVQRRRQQLSVDAPVQVFDRSPVCTVALARYAEKPISPFLEREADRVVREEIYEPDVFFVRLLGFVTPTAARRITYEQSLRFEKIHAETYREYGFRLVEVAPGELGQRVIFVDRCLQRAVTQGHRRGPHLPP